MNRPSDSAVASDPVLPEGCGPILALDIGAQTQDAVFALPETEPENWPRFVLPSPACSVTRQLETYTAAGKSIWLHGSSVGSGFDAALRRHLAAGLSAAATPQAAAALYADSEHAAATGVTVSSARPERYVAVHLTDYDPKFWNALLAAAGLPEPSLIAAAAQEHGFHRGPDGGTSNCETRFAVRRNLLESTQGDPSCWLYDPPPASLARLSTLAACTGGPVADAETAAVLGVLAMPEVHERSCRQGVTVVHADARHILAFLVYRERIFGMYEHHTELRDVASLLDDLKEFRLGWLPDEQVRASGGHGCVFLSALPPEAEGFAPVFALGPRREMLRGHGRSIAPYEDMMSVGCRGLIHGLVMRRAHAAAGHEQRTL